jgi:hypothetical protein
MNSLAIWLEGLLDTSVAYVTIEAPPHNLLVLCYNKDSNVGECNIKNVTPPLFNSN